MDQIVEWAKELQSLAQAGLFYGKDAFDRERYERIREIAAEMMAERTALPLETVKGLFCDGRGYQTPKVDTRAAIIEQGRILLVQERDGRWSMPGGWCDYNLSPAENIRKETKEEAGLEIDIDGCVAVLDRDKHNTPPYAYKVVQIFFLAHARGGSFQENLETRDSAYFSPEELPPLAREKCSEGQVRMCFEAYQSESWKVIYD